MKMLNRQRGATLVELMIGMLIGLIILNLSYQIFISNKATHNRILSQSRLQENARYAFSFIGNSIRNTGYRVVEEKLPDLFFTDGNNPIVSGVDGSDIPTAGEPAPLSFSTRSVSVRVGPDTVTLANVAEYSDVLVVRYQGASNEGPVTDCAGEAIQSQSSVTDDRGTADPSDDLTFTTVYVADIIYARVADATSDNRSRFRLHCRRERVIQQDGGVLQRYVTAGGQAPYSAVTLVEDVTAFQVRLGVDTSGDQVIDSYQTFTDNPDLSRVRSLNVLLDAKGGRTLDFVESATSQTISTSETLQRQFSQSFALRNLTR